MGAPSFFAFSPLGHLPLLLLLGVLHLLLLLPLLPFVLVACGVLPLRGFFRVMPFSLLSLRLLLVVLLLSSLRFPLGRYGSPLPVFSFRACCASYLLGFLCFSRCSSSLLCRFSVLCTRLICFFLLRFRFPSFSAGGESLWGGGGVSLFAASPLCQCFFVEGVPSVAFDAQCSPGPANSL